METFLDFLKHGRALGPLEIIPRDMAVLIVLLLLFAWVLNSHFWRPLAAVIAAREARIHAGEKARAGAERLEAERLSEVTRRLQAARREAVAVKEATVKDTAGEREKLLGQAKSEAAGILKEGRAWEGPPVTHFASGH